MKSLFAAFLSLVTGLALSQAAVPAQLGDLAAPLKIASWAKGSPVDLAALKGKQVAVIEFWATWCPPCRESIPHLTELQKKFPDVVFVGVSEEDAATVNKFVAKMGDQMDYHVAVDNGSGTSDGYMGAYGIDSIPHAFIVGTNGTVLWHGHPMEGLGEALEQIRAGNYDIAKASLMMVAQSKLEQFVEIASKDDQDPRLGQLGGELEAMDKQVGGIQPGQTFVAADVIKEIKFHKAYNLYAHALVQGASQEQLNALGAVLQASAPKDFVLAEFQEDMATEKTFEDYFNAAAQGADKATVASLAQKLSETKSKNVQVLNDMAWTILTDEHIQARDYTLAAGLAKKAVDNATKDSMTAALDTYALALFESGKPADAVTWEQKALASATSDDQRTVAQTALKKYQDAVGK